MISLRPKDYFRVGGCLSDARHREGNLVEGVLGRGTMNVPRQTQDTESNKLIL